MAPRRKSATQIAAEKQRRAYEAAAKVNGLDLYSLKAHTGDAIGRWALLGLKPKRIGDVVQAAKRGDGFHHQIALFR